VALEIVDDDRGELLHRVPLRDPAADLINVGDDPAEVNFTRVDDEVGGGHGFPPNPLVEFAKPQAAENPSPGLFQRDNRSGLNLLAAVLAGAAASGTLAVVGFFDFATRFGHGLILPKRGADFL
jgi:hypothetical protein